MDEPDIKMTLPVGTRVTLYDYSPVDDTLQTMFADVVETHNPTTKQIEFEDSDIGRADFLTMLNKRAVAVDIVY
jgi:hypothetical protein